MLLLHFGEMNQLVLGLFWMLLHSLWQALFVAAVAFILLQLTKHKSAQLRYGILASCLLLFLLSALITFSLEITHSVVSGTLNSSSNYLPINSEIHPYSKISGSTESNILPLIDNIANKYGTYVVLVWFICYLFHCIRFISGLVYIKRLSANNLQASSIWTSNLNRLQQLLSISKSVQIFLSDKVQVPVIFGVLKPIILIPMAVANQLPITEVEAILLHELAHIKRNDFLVNLIQTALENIFFFNPAIRWMSSRLREEREKCCDDIVVNQSQEKQAYINALVRFQESIVVKPTFEMALGDNQFQLFKRIKRIINKENKKTTVMDKTILFFSILSIATLGFMSGNFAKNQIPTRTLQNAIIDKKPSLLNQAIIDTVPDKKEKEEAVKEQKEIKERVEKNVREKLEELNRETELKQRVIMQQKKELERQMNDYKLRNHDQKLAEKMELMQQKQSLDAQLMNEKMKEMQSRMQLKSQIMQKELQMKLQALEREKEHMNPEQQKELEKELLKLKQEADNKNIELREEMDYMAEMKHQQLAEKMEMQREHLEQLKTEMEQQRNVSAEHSSNPEVEEIIEVLLESKTIDKTDPLSFKLTSKGLTVNDKKISSDLFNKLKDRFIHSAGDYIEYSHHGGSTSTSINKN